MPRSKRILKADSEKFHKLLIEMIKGIGAHEGDKETTHWDYYLATMAGGLKLTLYRPLREGKPIHEHCYTLFTRFEHVGLACRVLGECDCRLNPFSGKWNFHISASATPEEAVDVIRRALEQIKAYPAPKEDLQLEGLVAGLLATAEESDAMDKNYLDEVVHDTSSMWATIINNKGVETQIRFILERRGRTKEVVRLIETNLEQ